MRTWPKLTRVQKDLLRRLDAEATGALRYPMNRTYLRLVYEGMVRGETIISSWAMITQRGRDYVRFSLRA